MTMKLKKRRGFSIKSPRNGGDDARRGLEEAVIAYKGTEGPV